MATSASKARKMFSTPVGNGEFQSILRLQKEDADELNRILNVDEEVTNESLKASQLLAIKFDKNLRRGQLRIGDKLRGFTVKDLPTIVECYKTVNKVDIVKVADLSQIIKCVSTPEQPAIDPDSINQPGDFQSTREIRLQMNKSKSGLTFPMRNVVEKRFRKTKTDTKYIDGAHVKREVAGILRRDAEAETVKVEFLDTNGNRIDSNEYPLIEPTTKSAEFTTYYVSHLVHPGEICSLCNILVPEGQYHTTKNCTAVVLPEQVIRRTWHIKKGWEFKSNNSPRLASVAPVSAEKLKQIKDSLKPGYKRPATQPVNIDSTMTPVQVTAAPVIEKSPLPVCVPMEDPVAVVVLETAPEETVVAEALVEDAMNTPKPFSMTSAVKKSKPKKKKDPNLPKNPINAYLHWSKAHRADFVKPGLKGVDVTRAAARAWKLLTDKTVWQEMAIADKERYNREMAEFNARQCSSK